MIVQLKFQADKKSMYYTKSITAINALNEKK